MDEFALIRRYFSPLAVARTEALNLTDDAALLTPPSGQQLVVSTDTLVAGVHFIGSESPDRIAQKALRVNLSDLAAMGATPHSYTLALSLPRGTTPEWVAAFAADLADDQAIFNIALVGGDTTATPGPLTITITAFGLVPEGQALRRNAAQAGDELWVSGTLGDAALGLLVARGEHSTMPEREYFLTRYQLPTPRLALGQALRGIASAAMDVSDGLLQDLGHIAAASGLRGVVERAALPLHPALAAHIAHNNADWALPLSGGDDYELLFTAPPAQNAAIAALGAQLGVRLTCIGRMDKGEGVALLGDDGAPLPVASRGYQHF